VPVVVSALVLRQCSFPLSSVAQTSGFHLRHPSLVQLRQSCGRGAWPGRKPSLAEAEAGHGDAYTHHFLLEGMFMAFIVPPLPSDARGTVGTAPRCWHLLEDIVLANRGVDDAAIGVWVQ
jgi:hypothetical protein